MLRYTDEVIAGVTFDISPIGTGTIICNTGSEDLEALRCKDFSAGFQYDQRYWRKPKGSIHNPFCCCSVWWRNHRCRLFYNYTHPRFNKLITALKNCRRKWGRFTR